MPPSFERVGRMNPGANPRASGDNRHKPKLTPGFVWVQSSRGEKVVGAINGGSELGGMYIGRAIHENDLVPGKVHCSHGVLYLPWGYLEHSKQQYEVLVADVNAKYEWIRSSHGQAPHNAIHGKDVTYKFLSLKTSQV